MQLLHCFTLQGASLMRHDAHLGVHACWTATCLAPAAAACALSVFVWLVNSPVVQLLNMPKPRGSNVFPQGLHATCSCRQLHASPTAKVADRPARSHIHQDYVKGTVSAHFLLHCACCCWVRVQERGYRTMRTSIDD